MEIEVFKTFGEALAIGLLIGSERYRGQDKHKHQAAGIRTFSIICLLGATSALLQNVGFTLLTFASILIFMSLAYYRDSTESYGLTTEVAALFVFWLGYLLKDHESLAISTGIVLVILLAAKKPLHSFVREKVSEAEFVGTLKFLAVVFVVLPLLPNRYLGPLGFFNPSQVWMLIILISTISYAGYILVRVLGDRKGLFISSLLGGLVSTTAVTMSLAERARELPALSRVCGVAGVMANAVQFPRLLFLVWVVDSGFGKVLLLPMMAMAAVGFAGAWGIAHAPRKKSEITPVKPALRNPYALGPVLKFGAFFTGVFLFTKLAGQWFGQEGVLVASGFAGLVSVSGIALSLADMVKSGGLDTQTAVWALLVALTMNASLKWVLSYLNGTSRLAIWLGGGFLTMLGVGGCVIYFGYLL